MSTEPSETVALVHIGANAGSVGSVYVHATGFCKELWLQDPYRSLLVDRFRDATSQVIVGVGHLAPMEAPALIGDMIAGLIIGEARDEGGGHASGTIA